MELEYQIIRENKNVSIKDQKGKIKTYSIKPVPNTFLQWQSNARLGMFKQLQKGGMHSVKTLPAHLPVLATMNINEPFINLATKGLGLLPRYNKINEYLNLFIKTRQLCESQRWENTITQRMQTALKFYKDVNNFDPYLLGGLEIFEGQTAKNLLKNPFASLLYTGTAPKFLSFQFDGIVDIIQNKNLYYQFLLSARELFAFDPFHVKQIRYPFGYLFYVINIREKTPFSREKE
ncbi:MAG: hypothetical protein ACFFBH_08205 [Promethearchaeota archaeon]